MDTTDESTVNQAPVSSWEYLKRRWGVVLGAVAGLYESARTKSWLWWQTGGRFLLESLAFIGMVCLVLFATFFIGRWTVGNDQERAGSDASDLRDQIGFLHGQTDLLREHVVDLKDRMESLENPIAPQARNRPAQALRTAPRAMPDRPQSIEADPGASAWGQTDLDRAIEAFNQSIQEHQP